MNSGVWLLMALAAPLACATLLAFPRARSTMLRIAPFAPWPALGAATLPVGSKISLPWLLLGSQWGIDAPAPGFLLLTVLVWSAVGFHLRSLPEPPSTRYLLCFFGAMAGNVGVIIALVPLTYYTAFALLTFAAYGLIVTDAGAESRRAGRIYLILALAGELSMLAGFMAAAMNFAPVLALWGIYIGMGIKHGLLPFHLWLPIAHGTAPTPSSALLSGAILKAGLIGWIRFLAPGQISWETYMPEVAVAGGLAAALLAALGGILQTNPKMLLGYSSVSQMGLVTAAFGVAAGSGQWEALLPLIVLMAFHHATVKGALFLGLGVVRRPWVLPLLLLLSLSLAAAPGTGGALAKSWLSSASTGHPQAKDLLWLTSLLTALLMSRFLWLARAYRPRPAAHPWPFLGLAAAGLVGPWWLLFEGYPEPATLLPKALGWSSAWPVIAGVSLALAAWRIRRLAKTGIPALPPGDVVVLFERIQWPTIARRMRVPFPAFFLPDPGALENRLRNLPITGLFFFALLLIFVIAWS